MKKIKIFKVLQKRLHFPKFSCQEKHNANTHNHEKKLKKGKTSPKQGRECN